MVEGNTVVVTNDDDADGEQSPLDYGVDGNRMTIRAAPDEEGGPTVVYVLTR